MPQWSKFPFLPRIPRQKSQILRAKEKNKRFRHGTGKIKRFRHGTEKIKDNGTEQERLNDSGMEDEEQERKNRNIRMNKKVLVGMSGGVDSAVAAYLLQKEGYEVCGVTLRTLGEDESRCCEIDDARRVSNLLGFRFYPLNCVRDFEKEVMAPFVRSYLEGRTPNPCIECNRYIKWDKMLYAAKVLQADYVATGHYARLVRLENGRYTVKKAEHAAKDQTYMLYKLTQEQLAQTLMPLGTYSKEDVRAFAEEAGLPVAHKPDSQEICFVTDGHYADFVGQYAAQREEKDIFAVPGPGPFVDESGKVLGTHKGITHYTIGQRKGLGIALLDSGHGCRGRDPRKSQSPLPSPGRACPYPYAGRRQCQTSFRLDRARSGPRPVRRLLRRQRLRDRRRNHHVISVKAPAAIRMTDGKTAH